MRCPLILSAVALLIYASPLLAVIKVAMPVSKMYATSAAVLQGQVASVDPQKRIVEGSVLALKGAAPAEKRVRIQIPQGTGNLDAIRPESSFIVFISREVTKDVIHIGDAWLLAERVGESKSAWRTIQERKDLAKSYPGETRHLPAIVFALAHGESLLLDSADHTVFKGGLHDLGKLPITDATAVHATFANGDWRPDLIVSTRNGHRIFIATPDGFEEATDALNFKTVPTGALGAAMIDDDDAIWDIITPAGVIPVTETGLQKLAPLPAPPKGEIIGIGIVRLDGFENDPAFVTSAGQSFSFSMPHPDVLKWEAPIVQTLWKDQKEPVRSISLISGGKGYSHHVMALRDSGPTRYSVRGDPAPADFDRLTGEKLSDRKDYAAGLKNAAGVMLSNSVSSQSNYLIVSDAGLLLLIDRGFGAYLINTDPAQKLDVKSLGRLLAAADHDHDGNDDVFFLSPTGQLHVLTTASK